MLSWDGSYLSVSVVKVLAGAVLLVGAVIVGMTVSGFMPKQLPKPTQPLAEQSEHRASEASGQTPFARYSVTTEAGESLALAQGEYLVAMLSMSCEHCMASVPQLNEYVGLFPEIPVVALCWEPSEGSMAEFVSMSGPLFPMHSLGDNFIEFAELIGSAPPRLSFVRDGIAVQSWDDSMPDLETLLAAVASTPTS